MRYWGPLRMQPQRRSKKPSIKPHSRSTLIGIRRPSRMRHRRNSTKHSHVCLIPRRGPFMMREVSTWTMLLLSSRLSSNTVISSNPMTFSACSLMVILEFSVNFSSSSRELDSETSSIGPKMANRKTLRKTSSTS